MPVSAMSNADSRSSNSASSTSVPVNTAEMLEPVFLSPDVSFANQRSRSGAMAGIFEISIGVTSALPIMPPAGRILAPPGLLLGGSMKSLTAFGPTDKGALAGIGSSALIDGGSAVAAVAGGEDGGGAAGAEGPTAGGGALGLSIFLKKLNIGSTFESHHSMKRHELSYQATFLACRFVLDS